MPFQTILKSFMGQGYKKLLLMLVLSALTETGQKEPEDAFTAILMHSIPDTVLRIRLFQSR